MTAYNIVRTRLKPGFEKRFIEAHRNFPSDVPGFRGATLVKTGEDSFCIIGEWSSFKKLADARPKMIGTLDSIRHMLEDLGDGLGVTDPVSGEAVATIKPRAKPKKKKAAKKSAKMPKAKANVKKAAKKAKKKAKAKKK
jgi:hypothetical protein